MPSDSPLPYKGFGVGRDIVVPMRVASVALALLVTACRQSPADVDAQIAPLADSGRTYFPAAEWRTASPAAAGFDNTRMQALTADIDRGRYGAMHGIVVVRYGHVVLQHYAGWSRDQVHTMQSVTKSVTSLLLGILSAKSPTALNIDRPVLRCVLALHEHRKRRRA
jgi:CubicO group peptidase (beta-lactamase class C family)